MIRRQRGAARLTERSAGPMTTDTTTTSVDAVDAALAAAAGSQGAEAQGLAVAVLRLLADGAPVPLPGVGGASGLPQPDARRMLRSWPAVVCDGPDPRTPRPGLAP